MQKPPGNHPLQQAVEQAEDIYHAVRTYALASALTISDGESHIMLTQLRETLAQSKGILDGFEHRM